MMGVYMGVLYIWVYMGVYGCMVMGVMRMMRMMLPKNKLVGRLVANQKEERRKMNEW
jgi:hypothetical protein